MTNDIYFDECIRVAAPTRLYGIQPRGVLTGQVESLHSYLLELADRHSWSADRMMRQVLPDLASEQGLSQGQVRGWDNASRMNMLACTEQAQWLTDLLVALTGRREVRWLTLAPLGRHFCGQSLIAVSERVCLECLKCDIAAGAAPYGRLLWRLSEVSCCPLHRCRLVEVRCGSGGVWPKEKQFESRRLSGTCGQCGSIGFGCVAPASEEATLNEIWRAKQCSDLIASMDSVEHSDPRRVKDEVRAYCSRGISRSALAARIGVPKSQITRWLDVSDHRFRLSTLLNLAASEGFALANFLQGDLTRTDWGPEIHPIRERRTLQKPDPAVVDRALREALNGEGTIQSTAAELGVHPSTLARHEQLYVQLRDRRAQYEHHQRREAHQAAVAEAERVYRELLLRQQRPTTRNASQLTGSTWFPSQPRAIALAEIRRSRGDLRVGDWLKSHSMGPAFRACIDEACERLALVQEVGQATLFD